MCEQEIKGYFNFNSHAHVERDETSSFYDGENKNFNSHAHVERDVVEQKSIHYLKNFNSHAHVERDLADWLKYENVIISTHTLTWSVTSCFKGIDRTLRISTHTLTWSVTIQCNHLQKLT